MRQQQKEKKKKRKEQRNTLYTKHTDTKNTYKQLRNKRRRKMLMK